MKRVTVLLAALLAAGCSTSGTPSPAPSTSASPAGEPHRLVFDVTGTATITTLTCTIDGKTT